MSSVEQLPLLLQEVQSGDNAVRLQAEMRLYSEWLEAGGDRPAQLLLGLAQLASYGDAALRPSAAVILRRCATRAAANATTLVRVIDQIDSVTRSQVCETVLQGMLAPGQQPFTRHKLADAVAELARPPQGSAADTWPGLLETLAQATSHDDSSIRETTFRVLGSTPELLSTDMVQSTVELLLRGFEDPSETVRTAAAAAFSAFFVYLPKDTWAQFKPLLPVLLNVMEPFRQRHMEGELTSMLESLITLAELAPKMFAPVFETLTEFALAVAVDVDFDENTRMSALELMAAFAEEAPNMCKKQPAYSQRMVPTLLKMLTEVGIDDDDASEWQNMDDTLQIEEDEAVHTEAKLVMDRISLSLGGDAIVGPLFAYLPQMFASGAWRERFAALMALSNAAEGCREALLPQLGEILGAVQPLLGDAHPRVQWAACNALGQLSTDLAPEIQENYAQVVLPGLIAKLGPDSTFKVQAHAAAALVNFSDAADKDTMDPYLDSLLERLLSLVQSPKRYVQEQALTTIAMVADSAQTLFTKYFDTLMPLVLNILTAQVPWEYRLLKAKAIECATLIALAVGKQKFLPHLTELASVLLKIQQESPDGIVHTENGEEEDPCHAYLAQSWGRLCRVVDVDFVPYLVHVLPPLVQAATSQADCHILDVDQAESLRDAEGWEVVKYAGQWLGINTAAFEEKANAIELLHVYPRELGAAFYPYVPEILNEVVLPGIKFYYNARVRVYSCQLVTHLVSSAQLQCGKDSPEVLAVWTPVWQTLKQAILQNEREGPALVAEALLTVQRVVELLGPAVLSADDAQICVSALVAHMALARARLELRAQTGDDELDEFEEEADADEERDDEELIDASNKFFHALLKAHAQGYAAILKPVCDIIPIMAHSQSVDAQLFALEAVADVAEYCKQALSMEQFVLTALHGPPIVRAAAANAAGRIALHCPQLAAWALQALEPLFALTKIPHARSEVNVSATERACGAIARILRTHGAASFSAEQFSLAVGEWLHTLPVAHEPEGASYAYLFLSELVEKKHQVVLSNYAVAFRAVVQAIVAGTLQGKPAEYTVNNMKALVASLPQEKQLQLLEGLTEKERHTVQTVFS